MNIYKDLRKIKRQLSGQENHFGHKTTLAGQLYLLYCLLGVECYRTDKLHLQTKYLIGFWHRFEWTTAAGVISTYLLFEQKNNFTMFLNVTYTAGGLVFLRVLTPTASFWFGKNIEKFIAYVDATSPPPIESAPSGVPRLNINRISIRIGVCFIATFVLYASTGFVGALLSFEPEKLRDFTYYAIPLPQVHRYGCWSVFVSANVLGILLGTVAALEICAVQGITLIWAAFSHNQVSRISDNLASVWMPVDATETGFANPTVAFSSKQHTAGTFKTSLVRCVNQYQRVIRMIRTLDGFFTILSSISLPSYYLFLVAHLYNILLDDFSFVLKLKELFVIISILIATYYYFRVGDIIDELSTTMSFQVYSTPWYLSTQTRKDVYIFLCLCQHEITFKALKVYPITLRSFLRFLNGAYSTVNLLRRIMR